MSERGNLIKETRGKNGKLEKRFQYNLQNQLVRVDTNTRHETVSYKYDPLGRRIEKHDAFGTTRYRWTDNQLAQETRKGIKKTYLYEPASFRSVALAQNDQVYHYHLDHLGTPRELTDAQGKIVWRVKYKTYGNVALKEVEEIENNLRFQGQYFDEETGLHYNRFRYYNPDTGQFINQDPIGLLGGVNNYQYAPNPTGWIDPLGLTCKEIIPENYDPLTDTYTGVDINLFSSDEPIHNFAKKVKNNPNIFVVGGHGSSQRVVDQMKNKVEVSELAGMIQNHPKHTQGMPIYLLSCNTGKGKNSYAEQLSKELKAPVKAPNELLWYYPDGSVAPYAKDGKGKPDYSKPGKIHTFDGSK